MNGLTFEEALLSTCYSADGGILMPESFPRVEQSVLEKWKRLSFVDLTKEIFALFIDEEEIPRVDLEGNFFKVLFVKICSYSQNRYPL